MALIAVVDDVAVNRELLATLLKPLGHRISEAEDGVSALELVSRERPDLIICDILMPEMDGYEFVRRLRADPAIAAIPVVFCSAHFLELDARQLAEACGVSKVLTKPIDAQEMMAVVQAILGQGNGIQSSVPLPGGEFERQHLNLLGTKLTQKVAELQGVNVKLAVLIELNLQLASERDKERLLAHVCHGARTLLGAECGTVAVRAAGGDALAHVSHCGIDVDTVARMEALRLDRDQLGGVYRDAAVLHLRLSPDEYRGIGLPAGYPPVRELVAAPVKSLAASYGWICLANKEGDSGFSADDLEMLRILAAQAGRIYENGSLYAKLQDYAHELEAQIAERERTQHHLEAQFSVARILNEAAGVEGATEKLLAAICNDLGFAAATLWRVDEVERRLNCVDVWCRPMPHSGEFVAQSRLMTLAPDDGLPGAAWAAEKPVWASDLPREPGFLRLQAAQALGLRSGGAIPIMVGERVTGIIDVFRLETSELDSELANTLVTLGGQIGRFFERIAQQQRILRLTRVYAVLSGINSVIVRIHDRTQLFREACRIAVDEGGFGIAWLGEVDADTEEVVPVAWAGVGDDIGADRLSLRSDVEAGMGAVGQALREGTPCVLNELAGVEPVGRRREEAQRRGYRSLIALPLIVDTRVAGVLVLYAHEPDFFTTEELSLLTELANDISFALEYIAKQDMLAYLAYHDVLTGLPNRAHLPDRLGVALQASRHHPDDRVAVVLW
ncbi:MAG: response regulator receiver protein, partial [Betaproteobacteria bacterium HGW-Betaproteobacteria-21]